MTTFGRDVGLLGAILAALLLWKPVAGDPNAAAFRLILDRRIATADGVASIADLQSSGLVTNTTDEERLTNEHPRLVYTATKCAYADAIVDLLQTFLEINEFGLRAQSDARVADAHVVKWLRSSVDRFAGVKPAVARMTDRLLGPLDARPELRCVGDHGLLTSLLSVNLYLCRAAADGLFDVRGVSGGKFRNKYAGEKFRRFVDNVRELDAFVTATIAAVESSADDECAARTGGPSAAAREQLPLLPVDAVKDGERVPESLAPATDRLHLLANGGSDDYDAFASAAAYDPEYLLFDDLLNYGNGFLKTVPVRWNGEGSDLATARGQVLTNGAVEDVLRYQRALVDAVADVFRGQVHNALSNSNTYRPDIRCLQISFDAFAKKVAPACIAVCGRRGACDKIVETGTSLKDTLDNYDDIELFTLLEDRFGPGDGDQKSLYESVGKRFVQDPYLTSFGQYIRNSEQFASFARVFRLLSHAVHAD